MTTKVNIIGTLPKKTEKLATWSFVLGLLSFVCLGPLSAIPAIICGHIARSRIKLSGDTLGGNGMALSGLILGYAAIVIFVFIVLIGSITAAIAIPACKKAKESIQQTTCINNLQQIEAAKEMWAHSSNKKNGATPSASDLDPLIRGGFHSLHCPKGGTYTIHPYGTHPECSVPGHTLKEEAPRRPTLDSP